MQVNQNLNKFIPKILFIGNEREIPNDLPKFEIVGRIELRQLEPEVLQLFFDGQPLSETKLKSFDCDYVLFTDGDLYNRNRSLWAKLFPNKTFATDKFLRYYVSNVGFVDKNNMSSFYKIVSKKKSDAKMQILDLDAYLYRAGAFDFPNGHFAAPPPRKFFKSKLSSKILPKSSQFGGMFMTRFLRVSKKLNFGAMTLFS